MQEKRKSKFEDCNNIFSLKVMSLLTCLLLSLISQIAISKSQSLKSLTLSDILDATISTQESISTKSKVFTQDKNETTWLASSPTLGLNYFKSDQTQGTDELEVSVNLPFKSALQTQIDDKLVHLDKTLHSLFLLNQKLYFSGLIREQLWDIKIVQTLAGSTEKKLSFLARLEKQYQQLFQSAEITNYPLLLIQQEILNTKIDLLNHNTDLTNLMQQYQLLTGLSYLPKHIDEDNVSLKNMTMTAHPQIQKIDQEWIEFEQTMQLSSQKSEPWNLSLRAKKLDNNTLNETQLGVGIEVPITFLTVNKQSLSNEWQREKHNYDVMRTSQLIALQQQFQWLLSQQKALTNKQHLLEQSKTLSKAIITETQLLIDANQIEQGQAIKRMIKAFSTKTQLSLNQLFLFKNIAMLRQSAGISL